MFKNLPKGVKVSLFIFTFLLVLFIIFSASVRFFEFPFSVGFVKQQFMARSREHSSLPTDPSTPVSENAAEYSPWAALNNQDPHETQKPERYFEGPRFYEEIDGIKRLLLIEGIVDSIDSERKVAVIKHWNSEEIVEVVYGTTDLCYLVTRDQDGSILETEAAFSEVEIGDHVSYNPADSYHSRPVPIWIISR